MDKRERRPLSRRHVVGGVGVGMAVAVGGPALAQETAQRTTSSRSSEATIAHSGEDDQPFRPKVITDSGDRDHAVSRTARPGVIVAARRTADVSIGCIRMVGPVKATVDRPWSPWRGPTRVAQCPHERRSGARGEALWAPVGDRRHGAHAAVLSAATSRRRKEGPLSSMR